MSRLHRPDKDSSQNKLQRSMMVVVTDDGLPHNKPRQRKQISSSRGISQYGLQSQKQEEKKDEIHQLYIPTLRSIVHGRTCLVCLIIMLLLSLFSNVTESHVRSTGARVFSFQLQPRVVFLDNPYHTRQDYTNSSWIPTKNVSGKEMSFSHADEANKRSTTPYDKKQTGCSSIAEWQSESAKPNCNSIHEVGMRVGSEMKHLDSGGFKDVWQHLQEDGNPENFVLKTTIYRKGFSETYLDKHRRDALVMEQATKSPHVLNIHAYCAFSNVVERASGTLQNWIQDYRQEAKPESLLKLALAVAEGVEQSQLYHKGMPTVAHADIKSSQFLFTTSNSGPVLKINDFNRCRFLTSKRYPSICNFTIPNKHKGSTMRSPEEYTDNAGQNDKIDVFSTGSVLYQIITGKVPFQGESFEEAMEMIKSGKAPPLSEEMSLDPSILAIVEVMRKCRKYSESDRPSSSDVSELLRDALERYEKE